MTSFYCLHFPLQPPSPEHSDGDPNKQDEDEEEEPEQKTAYQKLLSTLSQTASNELSEESSDAEEEEEDEELLGEGEVFYLQHNGSSNKRFQSTNVPFAFFVTAVSDEDGEHSEDQNSDEEKEDEQDGEEPSSMTVEEERKESGVDEFIDEEHESQFCLETNFMDQEEEEDEADRTPEHKDSTGKVHACITPNNDPVLINILHTSIYLLCMKFDLHNLLK